LDGRDVIPTRLRCEHREDVPLIDAEAPRFGWVLEADGRDRRQSAYRILVASSAADLAAERGDLWDSGVVDSEATLEIAYAGQPLPPASELHWTVRVRDEAGMESAWAEPARFRTGLRSWRASWISCDREDFTYLDPGLTEDPDEMLFRSQPAPFLRRPFGLEQRPRRATLYATARGVLELQLNGRRVGDERLAPGWTDYRQRIEYSAHDVTELLGAGENVLGCILGDGWYAGFVGYDMKRLGAHYGTEPELLCELHVELETGTELVISSDDLWRSTPRGPINYSDLLQGERYDARRELRGWSTASYDDRAWEPVRSKALDGTALVAAQAQPIRVTEELRPVAVNEREPGAYVFDLGQNMVGTARLRTAGPAGTRIELRYGEVLDPDGAVYQGNLATARATDIFILAGEGEEEFEPRFTFHGFRFVEVTGVEQAPDAEALTGLVIHSDTPLTSSFSCSNEMVNQLHSNIVWGQRGNFVSVPTDCPQRDERLGWLADAQVFLPTASLNADVAAFMTKWADDVIEAQSEEGVYSDVAPRLVQLSDGAPAWADAGVIVPWVLYERYGDLRLLERHWPHMERYLAHLRRHNPDLLWKRRRNWDFGDWLAVGEEAPKELLATAYWAYDAQLMARMARALGKPEAVEEYERLAAAIAAAFNAAYVGEDALIEGDTQTGYLVALAFELLPEELRARAAERLVAKIERRDWHLTTGFLGVGLICPVLTAAGHADVAHRLLTQETFPSWGYTINRGATTIWERWDGIREDGSFQSERMNSFNHYSLGSVGAWMIESVLGIRNDPSGVAFERVLIEPVPGELTSARGSHRSIRGEIASGWSASEDRFRLEVRVPPNLTATVLVPARGDSLREGGEDAAAAVGVHSVSREGDCWRVEIGSGAYEFESV
jgi:alpha-L-rhamnosidase